ncbi:MAG TPA: hypothetical protein VH092_19730 [Urbifossiella sp.]|jgi:hypothetical protein|nr:hypothetical protein [Urbifossiella sp.]
MAFSPFNIFRRNQKAIFAVVTVFIMFTFVLSSGLGGGADFFDWFPRWLGGAGKSGDHLCTVDGERIYDRDVREVRFTRVMANRFMTLTARQTATILRREAHEKLVEATPMLGNPARQVLEGGNPQMFQMMAQMMVATPNARPQDKNLVAVVQAWMEVEQHRRIAEESGTYFLNAPNKSVRDVVDFMLWEKKADRMGITFTSADVKQLIQRECLGQFKQDVELREEMSREFSGRFTPNAVLKALAAEFKVRAAQTALLGPVSGGADRTLTAAPIFTTPFDLFSYYKDKTSPTAYEALAVPGASFAAIVKGEPTESEVLRLFNERKDSEPDPSREEPGFKEPRRVKVEWVAASGEEPYYKKAAADWITRSEFFAKGGVSTLTVPVAGVGPAAWAGAATAPMAATELLVQSMYKGLVDAHENNLSYRWGGPGGLIFPSQLLTSSYAPWANRAGRTKDDIEKKRPVYAAGPELAAQLAALGSAGIGGNALIQPTALYAQAVSHEVRDRGTVGGLLFLAGVPGPDLFQRVAAAEVGYRRSLPKALPVEAVRAELLTDLADKKARELAVADVLHLRAELTKLGEKGKARDKGAAAAAYAAEFVKTRGLKAGASTELVSEWTVREDPGLAPLREAAQKALPADPQHAALDGPFGMRFFAAIDPQRGSKVSVSGLYLPDLYPGPLARVMADRVARLKDAAAKTPGRPAPAEEELDREAARAVAADLVARGGTDPIYLAWRTEDQAAKSLPLAAARPRVVEAWRRAKGREEAKAAAEQFAARVRSAPGAGAAQFVPVMFDLQTELQGKFADPKGKERVKLFKVENVAPIQILNDLSGMARPFTLAGSPDIPFPGVDMAKKLIDERNAPPKTVFVVPDAPKDTYYVFALINKEERGVDNFRTSFYSQMGRGPVRDLVYYGHAQEAVIRTKNSVVALLRKEFDYQETDAQKAKLDERDKKGED